MELPAVRMLAFIGGDNGGKSHLCADVAVDFASKVIVVPETATIFLKAGFPLENWSQEKQRWFQYAIFHSQLAREEAYILDAIAQGKDLILDRPTPDIIIFWPCARFAQNQNGH